MIASYKRYELELLNPTATKEFAETANEDESNRGVSNTTMQSQSDLSIETISSQDSSLASNMGSTQASANLMLVFSGGAKTGGKHSENAASLNFTPKLPKRRNAVDSTKSVLKKSRKNLQN